MNKNILFFKPHTKEKYCILFLIFIIGNTLVAQVDSAYVPYIKLIPTFNDSSFSNPNTTEIESNAYAENKLNEVVVFGYGSQKKSNVSGAISQIQSKDLENRLITRLEDALKGATSGLLVTANSGNPGSASTVAIRGITSINSFEPLYVVDGVPVAGGIDYINSSDIASIEVLKDAASAAIYGTKAASGVILVSTKSGRNGVLKISFNSYIGSQSPDHILKLLNAQQYATLRNESAVAAGKEILFYKPKNLGTGTDWQAQAFNNNAKIENYELSMSGGDEHSTYFSSFGYYNQDGIVSTLISNYKRFATRFNSTHKIKPWLKFGNNFAYSYNKTLSGVNENGYFGGPIASIINLDPITAAVQTDPTALATALYANNTNRIVKDVNNNPYGVSNYVQQEMSNPLAYQKINEGNYAYTNKIVGNVFVAIEPINALEIKSNIGVDIAFYGSENFQPAYYLNPSNQNLQNSFSRISQSAIGWNMTNTLIYKKNIKDHHLTILLGQESRTVAAVVGVGATYINMPATNFNDASMNFSLASSNKLGYGWESQVYKMTSFFGRLTYDYQEKYLINSVLRYDGSSHFGNNNRFGYFPSVSLAWVPSKEIFWIQNKIINSIKIRTSYGINGNDNLDAFQYISTIANASGYTFGTDQFTAGRVPAAPANSDLKWEKTTQFNLGFDIVLFNQLKITTDYFVKQTSDMLMRTSIPLYLGSIDNPWDNVASMTNKGIEIETAYKNKIRNFDFEVKTNASYIKNEVTDIGTFQFIEKAYFQSAAFPISRTVIGKPIAEFFGFETQGIFQNQAEIEAYKNAKGERVQVNAKPGDFKWKDINNDGKISDSDRTYLGSPIPKFLFGASISANYKNIDIMLTLQGVYGNKIFQQLRRLDIVSANYTAKYWNRWTGEGTSNTVPRLSDDDPNNNFKYPNNFYVEDGSYLRIRSLQIGFTVPQVWTLKLKIEKLMLYASVNNLYTFTNYSGYNPEIGGAQDVYGIDRGVYPVSRTWIIGCNLNF